MGINRVLSFFVLFIVFSNALKSQVQINEEVIRRDSTLFVQLGMETDICPMMDLKLGVAIDQFLRAKKRLEKKKRGSGHYIVSNIEDGWGDGTDGADIFNALDLRMHKNWKGYKAWIKSSYEIKHDSTYHEEKEKKLLVERLQRAKKMLSYKPLFFKTIDEKYSGDVKSYVDALYSEAMMNNPKKLKKFARRPKLERLNSDIGAEMTLSIYMYKCWLVNYDQIKKENRRLFIY